MRLGVMDENIRANSEFNWSGFISSIGSSASDIITAVKAPGGSIQTAGVTPVPVAISQGSSGNFLMLIGLVILLVFLLIKK